MSIVVMVVGAARDRPGGGEMEDMRTVCERSAGNGTGKDVH